METMKMAIHSNPHRISQYPSTNNALFGQTSNIHLAELLADDSNNNNNMKNINNGNNTMTNTTTKSGVGQMGCQSTLSECAACRKPIKERFLLKALDQLWHEDCLKCACCDCRLGEVGSTLFTKANLILCKRDYLRLFGNTGMCSACNKTIPAFEMVMRAPGGRVYHLECFQCAHCNHRFCIGDRFHLHENRILCEYDYEELGCSAMMSGDGGESSTNNSNCMSINNSKSADNCQEDGSQMADKLNDHSQSQSSSVAQNSVNRPVQIRLHEDGSSGYGSPDSVMSDSAK